MESLLHRRILQITWKDGKTKKKSNYWLTDTNKDSSTLYTCITLVHHPIFYIWTEQLSDIILMYIYKLLFFIILRTVFHITYCTIVKSLIHSFTYQTGCKMRNYFVFRLLEPSSFFSELNNKHFDFIFKDKIQDLSTTTYSQMIGLTLSANVRHMDLFHMILSNSQTVWGKATFG